MREVLVVSFAPVFALLVFFYIKDTYEKEPLRLLLKAFLYGILSTVPAIILEKIITRYQSIPFDLYALFLYCVLAIGLVEEGSKYWFLIRKFYRHPEFNEPYDGIIYGVFVSLGFAAFENFMYVLDYGLNTGYIRAFTAVPGHAIYGAIMGYFVGTAKFSDNSRVKVTRLIAALLLATLTHGIYDFFAFQNGWLSFLLVIAVVIIGWRIVLSYIKKTHSRKPSNLI